MTFYCIQAYFQNYRLYFKSFIDKPKQKELFWQHPGLSKYLKNLEFNKKTYQYQQERVTKQKSRNLSSNVTHAWQLNGFPTQNWNWNWRS